MHKHTKAISGIFLLSIIALAVGLFFLTNHITALLVLLVFLVLVVSYYILDKKNQYKILQTQKTELGELRQLMKHKSSLDEYIIQTMPTGIIILDNDDNIVFANETAKQIFDNQLVDKSLANIHQPIYKALSDKHLRQAQTFNIYNTYYSIRYIEETQALFIDNIHEKVKLKNLYAQHTTVIGVLHLDNFEDALSILDVKERNEIQGKYLGLLDTWAADNECHLVPVSASKIYVYMHRKNLENIIAQDFDVLNDIAHISKEHDLVVTLSGGFACANIPIALLATTAEEALDLALSRGGDQIAINLQGEAFKYFGGNTNTQEKRTRISSRINAKKLDLLFETASTVFIMPHTYPDSDALGSAIGAMKMALAAKKEAYIIIDFDALDATVSKIMTLMEYEYVALLDYIISPEKALSLMDKHSALILVDHHSHGQLINDKILQKSHTLVIIDHHRKLTDAIEDVEIAYIEPYASSTSELIVEMLSVYPKEVSLNPFEATVILSGMIVDTNNFMYRTGARTFEAAAILRKFGADTYKIRNILRESFQDIQIKGDLLRRAEVINKRFAVVVIPDDIDADRRLLAKVADDLLEIDHVVAAFVIGDIEDRQVGISARSLEGFSVQKIMEDFGGGGHLNNAGAQIENTDKPQVKQQLKDYLEELKQEGRPMKVILQKDVKNQGKKGEVIEVAPGFGNYLLTSKQAIEATQENLQAIEDEQKQAQQAEAQHIEEMKALKKRIDHRAVKVYVKLGKNGKMFGKITTKQIADAFKEQHNIEIDKRKIQLDEAISALGTYSVEVKLHKDIIAQFELLVLEA